MRNNERGRRDSSEHTPLCLFYIFKTTEGRSLKLILEASEQLLLIWECLPISHAFTTMLRGAAFSTGFPSSFATLYCTRVCRFCTTKWVNFLLFPNLTIFCLFAWLSALFCFAQKWDSCLGCFTLSLQINRLAGRQTANLNLSKSYYPLYNVKCVWMWQNWVVPSTETIGGKAGIMWAGLTSTLVTWWPCVLSQGSPHTRRLNFPRRRVESYDSGLWHPLTILIWRMENRPASESGQAQVRVLHSCVCSWKEAHAKKEPCCVLSLPLPSPGGEPLGTVTNWWLWGLCPMVLLAGHGVTHLKDFRVWQLCSRSPTEDWSPKWTSPCALTPGTKITPYNACFL